MKGLGKRTFSKEGLNKQKLSVNGVQIITDKLLSGINGPIITFADGTSVDISESPQSNLEGVELRGAYIPSGVNLRIRDSVIQCNGSVTITGGTRRSVRSVFGDED